MCIKHVAVMSVFMLASAPVWADAARLHTSRSISIDASADKVWKMVKDFDGLATWHPAVAKDEIVEGKDNRPGEVRLLSLKGGGTIKEKLLEHNAANRTFKYSIVEGVLPVSAYTSRFEVKSTGRDKAEAIWSGSFKRKNTGDKPAENENDKTAVDTMNSVYKAGLDNLKTLAEAK